jgi:hypothetical protein
VRPKGSKTRTDRRPSDRQNGRKSTMRCASKGPEHDEVCVQRSKAYVGRRPNRPLGWAISPVITEEMKKQSHCNRGKSLPCKSKFPRHLRTFDALPATAIAAKSLQSPNSHADSHATYPIVLDDFVAHVHVSSPTFSTR